MDELKEIAHLIGSLPTLAVWVLVGFWCYKVVVIGSIYGVIKLAIDRLHSWKTSPQAREWRIGTATIDEGVAHALSVQISRIASTNYIHMSDIGRLRQALDIVLKEKQ